MDEVESLVALAQAGHVTLARRHDAFSELVARFQDMAFGYAYAILGDTHLAQDAAQEAFLAAYQNLPQLRDPRAFPGWLRRIVLTQTTRLARAKHVPIQSIETIPSPSLPQHDLSAMIERQELQEHIHAAIQALPATQRMATILYYVDGYSQREIAAFLEVSVDAVKKQLQRARSQLQERMIQMMRDDLHSQRPSKDARFVRKVKLSAALNAAAEQGQLTMIELMLVDGVDIDAIEDDGGTLLHWAARQGHLDAVELLIERGATINIRDTAGKTPLHEAMEWGHAEVADLLRRHADDD